MKLNKILVWGLRTLAVLIAAYFIWVIYAVRSGKAFSVEISSGENSESWSISDDLPTTDQLMLNISDSLPYYKYTKLKDSLENIKRILKSKNIFWPDSGGGSGYLAFWTAKKYDSVYYTDPRIPFQDKKIPFQTEYYLSLPNNYTLNSDNKIYREKGRTFLKYVVWDKTIKSKNGTNTSGHYEIKEIPFAVAEPKASEGQVADQKRTIYLPISKRTFTILRILVDIPLLLLGIWLIYIFFILPLRIIERIANGNAFSRKTIMALYTISFSLLGLYLLDMLIPLIINWIVSNKIPPQFKFTLDGFFNERLKLAVIGIIVFAIAWAFSKGNKLQQEQDLTI